MAEGAEGAEEEEQSEKSLNSLDSDIEEDSDEIDDEREIGIQVNIRKTFYANDTAFSTYTIRTTKHSPGEDMYFEPSILTFLQDDILKKSFEFSEVDFGNLYQNAQFRDLIRESERYIPEQKIPSALDEYHKYCHMYMLDPISAVRYALENEKILNLSRYGISNLHLYFLCKVLIGPPDAKITHFILSYNSFEDEACITLSELMQRNSSLQYISLAGCQFGPTGTEILSDGIALSLITHLNLSNCNLRDTGGVVVANALISNEALKELNLSHNNLHVDTATALEKALQENNHLEALTLEWNDFYPEKQASVRLMNGLRTNKSLKFINLSWNGITGNMFSKALMRVMQKNEFIETISLENNYLSTKQIGHICSGMRRSKNIQTLRLGGNYFIMPDFENLINTMERSPTMRNLDLGRYTYLSKPLYERAIDFTEVLRTKYGVDCEGIVFKGPSLPNPPDPVDFKAIIFDRIKFLAMKPKKKKLRRDMGHFMLKLLDDQKEYVKPEEFLDALKKFKARLDDDLIKQLEDEFTERIKVGKRKRKRVAIKEMAEAYLQRHPTDPPPPPKVKQKRKKKVTLQG